MADVVNLNKVRKARAQAAQKAMAAQNRARCGRPKADKVMSEAERRLAERRLDSHELED
jgi:hypothetical protein